MKKKRSYFLFTLLLATLVAAYFAPAQEEAVNSGAADSDGGGFASLEGREARSLETGAVPAILKLRARPRAGEEFRLFESPALAGPGSIQSASPEVRPPPPFVGPPLPPPPPQAPPLPFRAFGKYVDNGKVAVFLEHGNQNIVVRVGDRILGEYQVERIDDQSVVLLYLPLNQRQSLEVRATP